MSSNRSRTAGKAPAVGKPTPVQCPVDFAMHGMTQTVRCEKVKGHAGAHQHTLRWEPQK